MNTPFSAAGPINVADNGAPSTPSKKSLPSGMPKTMKRSTPSVQGKVEVGSSSNKPQRIPVVAHFDFPYKINVAEAGSSSITDEESANDALTLKVAGSAIELAMHNAVAEIGAEVNASQTLAEEITLEVHNQDCGVPLKVKMEDIPGLSQTSSVTVDAMGTGAAVSTGNFTVGAGMIKSGVCYRANSTHKAILRERAVGSTDVYTMGQLEGDYEKDDEVLQVRADSPVFTVMKNISKSLGAKIAAKKALIEAGQKKKVSVVIDEGVMDSYTAAKQELVNTTTAKAIHHVDLSNGLTFQFQHTDGCALGDIQPHLESDLSAQAKASHASDIHHGRAYGQIRFYVDLPHGEDPRSEE